jgi:hypothetical protein
MRDFGTRGGKKYGELNCSEFPKYIHFCVECERERAHTHKYCLVRQTKNPSLKHFTGATFRRIKTADFFLSVCIFLKASKRERGEEKNLLLDAFATLRLSKNRDIFSLRSYI